MDKSHFDIAYDRLSKSEKQAIDERIEEWKKLRGHVCEKVVNNFVCEHFLSVEVIEEIIYFIIRSDEESIEDIKENMRTLIFDKYLLKGEKIRKATYPKKMGFAMPREGYKNYLSLWHRDAFGGDDNEIDKFIDDACNGMINPRYKEERYYRCLFKEDYKLIWLTWEECGDDVRNEDPFCFMRYRNASEVRITLGLDERYYKSELLLFYVNIDKVDISDFVLYRPTFCDSNFYENFKPTPLNFKSYGLTQPLSDVIVVNGISYHPERRPECVLKSKYMNYGLIDKVEYINE